MIRLRESRSGSSFAALCDKADYVLAMGTCAAFGGIPAAPPNPTESSGLQFTNNQPGGLLGPEWRSRAGLPVLNLAGCPVDAATMIKTMGLVLKGMPLELDTVSSALDRQAPAFQTRYTRNAVRPRRWGIPATAVLVPSSQ